jgi:type III secretion protein R
MMKSLSPEVLLCLSIAVGIIPIFIGIGTCYLKFSIILSLLRSGFGTQQAPSNSLVMALSMVMSLVVMSSVVQNTADVARGISIEGTKGGSLAELLKQGSLVIAPWRQFLLTHSGDRELATFVSLAQKGATYDGTAEARGRVGIGVALAAFVLSEIKEGFIIAFLLLLPFFEIDLVVANVLVALGLTMVSPSTIGLPLKLLLFISTDGWLSLARSLVTSYQ